VARVVLSSGGLILIWILLMTLFLPDVNYSKSYATWRARSPTSCPPTPVASNQCGPAQRASFAYYAHCRLKACANSAAICCCCKTASRVRDEHEIQAQHRGKQWVLLWEGRRPADREERFRLYRRAD
jgi:hypothetical protein